MKNKIIEQGMPQWQYAEFRLGTKVITNVTRYNFDTKVATLIAELYFDVTNNFTTGYFAVDNNNKMITNDVYLPNLKVYFTKSDRVNSYEEFMELNTIELLNNKVEIKKQELYGYGY